MVAWGNGTPAGEGGMLERALVVNGWQAITVIAGLSLLWVAGLGVIYRFLSRPLVDLVDEPSLEVGPPVADLDRPTGDAGPAATGGMS
jgi:hypothetical protein